MRYTWASATHVGLVRTGNEDSVRPMTDGSANGPVVIAVADGMGGAVAGEGASRIAIEAAVAADPDAEPVALWRAASLEEEWQADLWGRDHEAEERRAKRQDDFLIACEFTRLARPLL